MTEHFLYGLGKKETSFGRRPKLVSFLPNPILLIYDCHSGGTF